MPNPVYQNKAWTYDNIIQYANTTNAVSLFSTPLGWFTIPDPPATTFTDVETSGGTGVGLTINVTTDPFGVSPYIVEINNGGYNYTIGDVITFNNPYSPSEIITFTVLSTSTILDPKTELLKCNTSDAPVNFTLLPIGDYWDYEYKLYVIDSEGNGSTNNITIYAPDSHLINGQTGVTINNDYGSALIRVVDSTNYIAQFGKSFDQLIDITYNELYSKVVNGNLIPTQWYRLTDYKSVNFLNGWETADELFPLEVLPNYNPREIYTGENEVLILQAISPNEISKIGYSETYPGDIIQYEPYTNKIGVNIKAYSPAPIVISEGIFNGATLPDLTIVSGFDLEWDVINNEVYFNMPTNYPALFGHYFYVECEFSGGSYTQSSAFDPIKPGILTCQFCYSNPKPMSRIRIDSNGQKIVLVDLDYNDFLNYDTNTLRVYTMYEIGDAYGWITRRQDTFRNIDVPFDFRGRKYRRFEGQIISGISTTDYWLIGFQSGSTGNYKDFKCFDNDGYETSDILINSNGGPDNYNYANNDNIVCARDFKNNTLTGIRFDVCTFLGNVENNLFLGDVIGNSLHSVFNNVFGCSFKSNKGSGSVFRNVIESQFTNNKINGTFYENKIHYNFVTNTIGDEFHHNITEGAINNCIIGNNFRYNNIKYPLSYKNFSSATYVYGDYNCDIYKRPDGQLRLSYYDNLDTLVITGITS